MTHATRTTLFILCAAASALAACDPSTFQRPSYVSDVSSDGQGGISVTRCYFDGNGEATNECFDDADAGADQADASLPPTPDELAHAGAAAQAADADDAVRAKPPTGAAVDRALAAPGVLRLVALCRTSHPADAASFAFALRLARSGKIRVEPHDAATPFSDCAARALATANLGPFDGAQAIVFQRRLGVE